MPAECPNLGFPYGGWLIYLGYGCQPLNQLQEDREVVIAYASQSLRLSQRWYCTTHREMLAAVVMCTHFRSYLRGDQFTLHMVHSSLQWLQKFRNSDGMLARWYMLLGQFSVIFEYRPDAQHANTDGLSRQCGQCSRPDCPVSAPDTCCDDTDSPTELLDQPFESGETWVAATYLEELTADLLSTDSEPDFIIASRRDQTLATVCRWVQTRAPPAWLECSGLSPELRCWRLQFGNLSIDTEGRLWHRRVPPATSSQLVVHVRERRELIS